jgi:hypothetical protein
MRNAPKSQEKIHSGEQSMIVAGSSLIELGPDQLRAVVGGRKPVVEITVKPDGTIVIVQK